MTTEYDLNFSPNVVNVIMTFLCIELFMIQERKEPMKNICSIFIMATKQRQFKTPQWKKDLTNQIVSLAVYQSFFQTVTRRSMEVFDSV